MKRTKASLIALAVVMVCVLVGMGAAQAAPTDQGLTDEQALEQARLALTQLLSGSSADIETLYAQFDATMQSAVSLDALTQGMASLPQQVGAYQSELTAQVRMVQGYQVVTFTLQFELAVLDFNLAFDADGKIAGLNMRPSSYQSPDAAPEATPDYMNPAGFTETTLTFESEGGYVMGCTLAVPANADQPVPAITIMSGSGAQDRDGTYGPNAFYRDFAQGIASAGVAVLRCDDRTYVYGTAYLPEGEASTVEHEFLQDARAAVNYLQHTDGINPEKVFVLGHSEGGYLVPRLLESDPSIGGGIMAAGTLAETLTEAMVRQITYLINLDGTVTEQEQQALDDAIALDQEAQALTADVDPATMLGVLPASYLLDLNAYDAIATAQAIPQPLLIVGGDRDYQVDQAGFEVWQTALADRPDTTFTLYPGLNHLFMRGEGAPNGDEYLLPGHVDAQVIADIAAWVLAH